MWLITTKSEFSQIDSSFFDKPDFFRKYRYFPQKNIVSINIVFINTIKVYRKDRHFVQKRVFAEYLVIPMLLILCWYNWLFIQKSALIDKVLMVWISKSFSPIKELYLFLFRFHSINSKYYKNIINAKVNLIKKYLFYSFTLELYR